jgi:hypothetical protein
MRYLAITSATIVALLAISTETGSSSLRTTTPPVLKQHTMLAGLEKTCSVHRIWAQDFHGNPYVRKIRACPQLVQAQ